MIYSHIPEVQIAVSWWVQKVQGFPTHDMGEADKNSRLNMFNKFLIPASQEEAWTFGEALARLCDAEFRSAGKLYLHVEYELTKLLSQAYKNAFCSFSTLLFPIKTSMFIKPGEVFVVEGYSGTPVTLYEAAKSSQSSL
jgi:hypothetical protein